VDNAFFAIKTPPLLKGFNHSLRNLTAPNAFLIIRPTLFGHYSHPEPSIVILNKVKDLVPRSGEA